MLDEFDGSCDVQWRFDSSMDYTDAPPQPEPVSFDTMECPFCGTTLSANAQACTNCDWTREASKPAEPKARDARAVLIVVFPGLAHNDKCHHVTVNRFSYLLRPH